MICSAIEEYDLDKDEWNEIHLTGDVFIPAEVCQGIQVSENQLLIFGGCDHNIKDLDVSYLLNIQDYTLKRTEGLAKANVFINTPFVFGDEVYVVGNKYYVKNRHINCYNIKY